MSKQKILIIEDERTLQEVLTYNLEREGFEVSLAADGQDGLRKARSFEPDLILLDLMLPVIDGLEVCRQLRADAKTQGIRVLMLTARSEEVDEIVGFNMGADDYVTKPFKVKPLIHRIKALLRRAGSDQQSRDIVSIHGIEVDRVNHTAKVSGQPVDLTPTEFRLLWSLGRAAGRPFGRNANALERTIDVHIRSLRQKLGSLGDVIETVRGVGYRFRGETESPGSGNSGSPDESD